MHSKRDREQFASLDARIVTASKGIKVLTHLAWPEELCEEFLRGWRAGNPSLPRIDYDKVDYSENINELNAVAGACDRKHPVGEYLYQTAQSYSTAASMLAHRMTPTFTEHSIALYGRPSDLIGPGSITHLDAASHFLEMTREFITAYHASQGEFCITSQEVARRLREELTPFFHSHPVEVVIDPNLTSKAAASARRIRVRAATCFSNMDIDQLIQHEGLVHMLTMLNGREQPCLKSMGLGSPRTTRTQEGLSTFAELVTGTIDLNRLQRIALRIHAVHKALEGADFIEIFRFFLDAGQTPEESFFSAARVFRGGDPRGGVVFTKDVVYLEGLIFIHTFLRKAVQQNKFRFPNYLFAGRLTLADVVNMEPFFDSGLIAAPQYEPPWLQNRQCLAAYLCYSIFANRISLGDIRLEDFSLRAD